jgi:hypothetical protein
MEIRYPIVELRQYTLRPGRRDELIDLFDREFVETQEAAGMAVLGQFRDLDDPDRFVWLRGFPDMPGRAAALGRFYGGPVWREHGAAANATMIDSDDVLLLRPATDDTGFPAPTSTRPAAGEQPAASEQPAAGQRPAIDGPAVPSSRILATIHHGDRPHERELHPAPLARLQTEHAENTFPALPVRTGEDVFVWFARFENQADLDRYVRETPAPARTQRLRLAPTARSLLR